MTIVVGITMVRDEADVIGHTLRHMVDEGLDAILVLDNGSVDGTARIAAEVAREQPDGGCRIEVFDDHEVGYYQSRKMTNLAMWAHARYEADWIVPFDADEVWYGPDRVANMLRDCASRTNLVWVKLWNHYCTSIDPPGDNPFETMQWRMRNPGEMPKVAFRWEEGAVIHQGNHGVDLSYPMPAFFELGIRHFSYRSADQMVRKSINGAEAYAATDLPESEGAHWRSYGRIIEQNGEEAMREVFREHFWYRSPADSGMVHDPAPWMRWR